MDHWRVVLLLLAPNQRGRSGVWTSIIHHPVTILSPPRPVPADAWRALGKTSAHVQSPRAVPQSLPQRLNFRFGSINKSTSSDVCISKRHFMPPHNVIMRYIFIYVISIVGNTRWTKWSLLCCLFRFFRFASRRLFEVQFQHLSTVLQRCGSYQYRRWPWCLSIISWRAVFTAIEEDSEKNMESTMLKSNFLCRVIKSIFLKISLLQR